MNPSSFSSAVRPRFTGNLDVDASGDGGVAERVVIAAWSQTGVRP